MAEWKVWLVLRPSAQTSVWCSSQRSPWFDRRLPIRVARVFGLLIQAHHAMYDGWSLAQRHRCKANDRTTMNRYYSRYESKSSLVGLANRCRKGRRRRKKHSSMRESLQMRRGLDSIKRNADISLHLLPKKGACNWLQVGTRGEFNA